MPEVNDLPNETARMRGLHPFTGRRHRHGSANIPIPTMNLPVLLWGLLFGSIGLGFFLYGKKQRAVVPLICGLALMVYPYFIPNVYALVMIGIVLIAVPYFWRL
jgi:hypothetical protein